MDGDGLFTIGALARRTGLTVKTIRFYSERAAASSCRPRGRRGADAAGVRVSAPAV
ncbi:putative transcriptional regulator [Streptacidiphilus sp. EB129]